MHCFSSLYELEPRVQDAAPRFAAAVVAALKGVSISAEQREELRPMVQQVELLMLVTERTPSHVLEAACAAGIQLLDMFPDECQNTGLACMRSTRHIQYSRSTSRRWFTELCEFCPHR
jgi:hypothetical protein